MTRLYRGRSRRLNGSMVIRSQSKAYRVPPAPWTGPTRRRISSNARGQSSSVPSSNPIKCLESVNVDPQSAKSWHVMGELGAPGRPVVRHVEAPQVELVPDSLPGEQPGELLGAWQRSGGVFPPALAAHQQQADLAAQPVEVVPVQVADVVQRVVEVRLAAALAPAVPGRGVVVARQAHRQ